MHRVCQNIVLKMLSEDKEETQVTQAGHHITMTDRDKNFLTVQSEERRRGVFHAASHQNGNQNPRT